MTIWRERTAVVLILATAIGFIVSRLIGHQFLSNNWSLLHWQNQPWWYSAIWSALFITAIVFAFLKSKQIAEFFNSRLRRIAGFLTLIILLVLFQFDSILFAGGNLRVAQFAQTDYIIHRWYEFGSSLFVSTIYELFQLFGMVSNTAAVFAWATLLWISTLLSLWGSLILTGELTKRTEIRFWLFLIIFFGPQTLAYLGLLGPNITTIPVIIWLTLFAFRAMKNRSLTSLVMVWLVVIIGAAFNYLSALLIPAAVYITFRSTLQLKRWSIITTVSTAISLVIVVSAFYFLGWKELEFTREILFLGGKHPFVDYGLFSERHLSDMAQILFLVFPQVLVVLFLYLSERRQAGNFFLNGLSWLLLLIGAISLFVIDPVNNIILDLPRLVVFLTAAGIVAACVVRLSLDRTESSPRLPALLAVLALFIPFSFALPYSKISAADSYLVGFLEKHESHYIKSGLAMRDAYFYKKEFKNADRWEQLLPAKSGDYLGFLGAEHLAARGAFDGAAEELYRLKTKYPFWTQPRALLAHVQMNLKQFEQARAELDTLLMLEPYNQKYHENLSDYFIVSRNYFAALDATENALKLFPENKNLLVNKMTALFLNGKSSQADSLARDLIRIDSTLSYPFLYRAMILEREGNQQMAARNYERFLKLSPEAPEAPEIRKRLNAIVLESQSSNSNSTD